MRGPFYNLSPDRGSAPRAMRMDFFSASPSLPERIGSRPITVRMLPMRSVSLAISAAMILLAAPGQAAPSAAIKVAVANPARLESEKPRDRYRHPAETL